MFSRIDLCDFYDIRNEIEWTLVFKHVFDIEIWGDKTDEDDYFINFTCQYIYICIKEKMVGIDKPKETVPVFVPPRKRQTTKKVGGVQNYVDHIVTLQV